MFILGVETLALERERMRGAVTGFVGAADVAWVRLYGRTEYTVLARSR